jgi:hypothetical protein
MNRSLQLVASIVLAADVAAQAPRIRDSAGVRIIENGPRLTSPIAFRLGDKPTFDYGGLKDDPVDELSNRNGYPRARRLSSGNVVLTDATRLLFFDASGKRIKAFGRAGDGPGEFRQVQDVCETHGDTVLVVDGRRPLTRLTRAGELLGTVPVPEGQYAEESVCFSDGTYALMSRVPTGDRNAPAVYRFTRFSPKAELNLIADHQGGPFDAAVRTYNPKFVFGDHLYFVNSDAYEIQAYDKNGKLTLIRTTDKQVPLSDEQKGLGMGVRGGASPSEIEDSRRRAIANSTTKYVPTVRRMFVDLAGRIWLEDWQPTEDVTKATAWTAFDSTGRLLGRLALPGGRKEEPIFVVGFGKDEIWFRRMDADGAWHYTAYPILPVKK